MDVKTQFGCQMWLEPTDTAERVDHLFAQAAATGIGWIRLFLMWNWIERQPDEWDFGIFDLAFDSAQRHGIQIKATLTANSGAWHIGTPSMLHSHTGFLSPSQREPMRRYILKCAERYGKHPALGQWILWNEPNNGADRTDETLAHWRAWLDQHYSGDLEALNKRWRTGYTSFDDIPFPEDVPHPVHQNHHWNSYAPSLLDWQSRAAWLNSELAWVKAVVREIDPVTELCVNPTEILSNQAAGGTDLLNMAALVDVIGASYHPAWHFTYADRAAFPALMIAGVRHHQTLPTVQRVEVTEVQTGNTLNSGIRPNDALPSEIAQFYLASLAAGAESVTGWCLNTRSYDFEAGDWGLLDDMDAQSPRSQMLRRVHDGLQQAYPKTGAWKPAAPRAWIGIDPHSQAIEWVEGRGFSGAASVAGRRVHDGAHGAALLAVRMLHNAIPASITRVADLPTTAKPGDLIVLSHLVAWEQSTAERLLTFVESGGCLLIDGTSGRKTLDAALHRPWFGGLADKTGLRAVGLQSNIEGYELNLHGLSAGRTVLGRVNVEMQPEWSAWETLRFADGEACVLQRAYGHGRIVLFRGLLGPSLVHQSTVAPAVDYLLRELGTRGAIRALPDEPNAFVLPVDCDNGTLTAVFAPPLANRSGRALRLIAPTGHYFDFWSRAQLTSNGELTLAAAEGVALLWGI